MTKTTLEYGEITETYECDEDEALRRHCSAVLHGTEDRWTDEDILDRYNAYCTDLGQDGLDGIKVTTD